MKKLFGVMSLILLLTHLTNAQAQLDREFDGLKGSVKTVRLERAEVSQRDGKAVESPRQLESVTTYDEKGNKTEALNYDYKGISRRSVFTRGENGNQIQTKFKPDGSVDSKWIQTYDARGRMSGGAQYNADGVLQRKSVSTYDPNGKFVDGAMYNADGSLINKTVYRYDAEGKPTGLDLYNANGVLIMKSVDTASESVATLYNDDGTVQTQFANARQSSTQEFDSHKNWIKQSTPKSVVRAGQAAESVEVLYRTITYY